MPSINIYIRQDDYPKWLEIKDKPTFLHNALNVREAYRELEPKQRTAVKKVIKTAADAVKEAKPVTYKNTQNWGA